jgi:PIN domain nuclease of toxin-antitoxin system
MRLLLDTQCWLWMLVSPERFTPETREMLVAPGTELFLSAASAWEIAIKYALGKLPLPSPPYEYVPSRMKSSETAGLPVELKHALYVATLPPHHRDPIDRLIIAQAHTESLPVLSADESFALYEVDLRRP